MCCWRVSLWRLVVVVVSRRVALAVVLALLAPALLVVHRHRLKRPRQQKRLRPRQHQRKPLRLKQRQRKQPRQHQLKQPRQHQLKPLRLQRQHQQKPHQRHLLKKLSLSSDPGSLSSISLLLLRDPLSTRFITPAGVCTGGRFFVGGQSTVCPGQRATTPLCSARRFLRVIS